MELARQLLAVLFVLGLLVAALWALRRRGVVRLPGGASRGMRQRNVVLIERVPLTAQHAVHLVRVGDKALLIGTAPSGCSLIDSLSWKEIDAGQLRSGGGLS